jgi:hypothetical protein
VMETTMIEKQWREFCLACFGNISEQQYIDLRRAFYGGASALYFSIMRMLDPGDKPTEADLEKMHAMQAELYAFNEEVKAGRA